MAASGVTQVPGQAPHTAWPPCEHPGLLVAPLPLAGCSSGQPYGRQYALGVIPVIFSAALCSLRDVRFPEYLHTSVYWWVGYGAPRSSPRVPRFGGADVVGWQGLVGGVPLRCPTGPGATWKPASSVTLPTPIG